MLHILFFIAAAVVILHGLIHLMGFVAYWPVAEVAGLPYKTTLLGQHWSVGTSGMRLYSILSWWLPPLGTAVIVSLIITVLDWSNALRGALLNLVILVPLLLLWGLRIQLRPISPYPEPTPALTTISLATRRAMALTPSLMP